MRGRGRRRGRSGESRKYEENEEKIKRKYTKSTEEINKQTKKQTIKREVNQ